ncbi:FAD-binding protein [Halorussus halophilus]|uniref:FAD-binding protein n=1 Tax=Halorussus halophilus TaxID=2650975 RepID=UPI0013014A96|nr:FAD-binding protein [Halorussus halophilus]
MTTDYDVIVVGGGVAGLSAGVFTARAELDTLVLNHGVSILQRNAHLENYLGFPLGIDSRLFGLVAEEQAEEAGCEIREQKVTHVTPRDAEEGANAGFDVETDSPNDDGVLTARRVVAASWKDSDYLGDLDVERIEDGSKQYVSVDDAGRTGVEGLYAAGRLAEQYHQAIVAAGHGAQVGLTLVHDADPEFYHDWVVPEGYFTGRDRDVPKGCEEISETERKRRAEESHARLAEYLDTWDDQTPVPHPSFREDF